MVDPVIEVSARLSVYEFLLEILCANLLSATPDPIGQTDKFAAGIIDRIKKPSTVAPGSPEAAPELSVAVKQREIEIVERFSERLKSRIRDVLKEQSRGHDPLSRH